MTNPIHNVHSFQSFFSLRDAGKKPRSIGANSAPPLQFEMDLNETPPSSPDSGDHHFLADFDARLNFSSPSKKPTKTASKFFEPLPPPNLLKEKTVRVMHIDPRPLENPNAYQKPVSKDEYLDTFSVQVPPSSPETNSQLLALLAPKISQVATFVIPASVLNSTASPNFSFSAAATTTSPAAAPPPQQQKK